jgi:hypothetical protein
MEDEINLNNDIKFNNYVMYKICPIDKLLNYCYIGHTSNFNSRKTHHKAYSENPNLNKSHQKLYTTIYNNGGWSNWEMVEIEQFKCKTKLEARIREQQLIEELNANLNSCSAYISEEKRKEIKKTITDKYRKENKAKIREQEKKYKEDHKEIITEQMKKYRAEHKKEIYEKSKEYREKNKEKFQEIQRVWREKNKEILKEKRKIYEAKKKLEKSQKLEANSEKPDC